MFLIFYNFSEKNNIFVNIKQFNSISKILMNCYYLSANLLTFKLMLINISNNPIEQWSQKQINSAKLQYGEIFDLQPPEINPEWDTSEITLTAIEFTEKIIEEIKKSKDSKNAVHLMGELTFCFSMSVLLHEKNIKCVASTTNKITRIGENCIEISEIEFVKFREYF